MTVVVVRVDESELACGSEHGNGGSLDSETDESENNAISVLEPSLGIPENMDERSTGKDVGDNGANEPNPRLEVSDIVESAYVRSLQEMV